jgi:hypothetical protein
MTVDEIVRDLLLESSNPCPTPTPTNPNQTNTMQDQNKQIHVPNTAERIVDTGTQLFNLKAERTRKGLFITAYCAGVTMRSNRLELPRILDTFIDAVVLVCGLEEEEHEDAAARVEDDIRAFVQHALTEL